VINSPRLLTCLYSAAIKRSSAEMSSRKCASNHARSAWISCLILSGSLRVWIMRQDHQDGEVEGAQPPRAGLSEGTESHRRISRRLCSPRSHRRSRVLCGVHSEGRCHWGRPSAPAWALEAPRRASSRPRTGEPASSLGVRRGTPPPTQATAGPFSRNLAGTPPQPSASGKTGESFGVYRSSAAGAGSFAAGLRRAR